MKKYRLKIDLDVGRLIKGTILSQLRKFLDGCQYDNESFSYEIKEYKGFLSSNIVIYMFGDSNLVSDDYFKSVDKSIMDWLNRV